MTYRQRLKLIFETLVASLLLSFGFLLLVEPHFLLFSPRFLRKLADLACFSALAATAAYPHFRKQYPPRIGPRSWLFFALHMADRGWFALWGGLKLRRMAMAAGLFPIPLSEEFIVDLTLGTVRNAFGTKRQWNDFKRVLIEEFNKAKTQLESPRVSTDGSFYYVNQAMARHGLLNLPPKQELAESVAEEGLKVLSLQENPGLSPFDNVQSLEREMARLIAVSHKRSPTTDVK